jgi:hypothetical protein
MLALPIVRDAEFLGELCIELDGLFDNMLDHSAARAALENRAQAHQFFRRADGINFHPAIAKIAHVARKMQPLGFILREITEADSLYDSGNEVAAGDSVRGHQVGNCSIASSECDALQAGEQFVMLLQSRKGNASCHMLVMRILQTSEKVLEQTSNDEIWK